MTEDQFDYREPIRPSLSGHLWAVYVIATAAVCWVGRMLFWSSK